MTILMNRLPHLIRQYPIRVNDVSKITNQRGFIDGFDLLVLRQVCPYMIAMYLYGRDACKAIILPLGNSFLKARKSISRSIKTLKFNEKHKYFLEIYYSNKKYFKRYQELYLIEKSKYSLETYFSRKNYKRNSYQT